MDNLESPRSFQRRTILALNHFGPGRHVQQGWTTC